VSASHQASAHVTSALQVVRRLLDDLGDPRPEETCGGPRGRLIEVEYALEDAEDLLRTGCDPCPALQLACFHLDDLAYERDLRGQAAEVQRLAAAAAEALTASDLAPKSKRRHSGLAR
jgi:hypothetical protein